MNSYERVITALNGDTPDRVPVVEFVIDPKVRLAICPTCTDAGLLADHLDLDMVGCSAVFARTAGDDREWIDEWGVSYQPSPEVVPHPIKGPLDTLESLRKYTPPDPDLPLRLGQLPGLVERYKGRRAIAFHHRAAFMWSCYLLGMDNMLMALAAEPDLADAVLDTVADVNERICRNAVRAGADVVVLGDDYAMNSGPLFSPTHFRRSILPRLQRVVDAIHEEGGLVIKHSDGNLWPLLDMIVETGIDGLNPIEPTAGMSLAEVKQRYGKRVCLVGNIDCGELLSHGSADQVEQAVRQAIADAAPGGGYMLSSSNSIHSSVNPRNYCTMVRACHQWGSYADVDSGISPRP
jgi:uroporphyrinogen decarboxylase